MSYTITYNDLTMDENSNYHINKVEGLSKPEVRTSQDYLTGGDGGNIWEQKYGFREISIEGIVRGSTVSEFFSNRSDLISAFSITDTTTLGITLWDGSTYSVDAHVIEMPLIDTEAGLVTHAPFRVVLRSDNPFIQGEDLQTASIGLPSGGGFPVASTIPTPIGGETGGRVVVDNAGNLNTVPDFEIKGYCVNPSITNDRTGETFTVNVTVPTDDILYVTQTAESGLTITLNGVNQIANYSGDTINLLTGNNTIRFNAASDSDTAELTINYYYRYLGI